MQGRTMVTRSRSQGREVGGRREMAPARRGTGSRVPAAGELRRRRTMGRSERSDCCPPVKSRFQSLSAANRVCTSSVGTCEVAKETSQPPQRA